MPKFNRWWILKPAAFLLCLVPMTWLTFALLTDRLSANPLADVRNLTGTWTLRFLMITLAVTPLRKMTGWVSLIRFRRMLGLFAFFHGFLHFITYVWLDQFFLWDEIMKDIVMRPYITMGVTSFVLMIPLTLTSTRKWIRRLGGRRWQMLHRLIYVSAAAGVVHYLWLVKSDIERPVLYGALLATLLGIRVWYAVKNRRAQNAAEIKAVS
jgi:sulfoxide reductase heme-binding subunit YedZ